ncbi:tryptophan-rich sensory protein [Candidatus Falkowbacteria bacterium]|jgi:translocator protein|nr:tryptophan-rich sensory protein [Candidatus Falkowbacteria bacterium]MBT5503296.1 tryptophan-rich sensory protein [Candidatus Falkowbacteria bacterium]MBT6574495.1 tryptophan-rich sensory protein [Candidatus Falkowbacteria bacterium]MBT7500903.1 tryptophan-rich sensory protein [Candidatus Falkowbacteria bacterium]
MFIPKAARLFLMIVVCQLAGLIGSVFTTSNITSWYQNLTRPSFAPPNWVFAPVWTILFVLMAIALFIAWENKFKKAKLGLLFFVAQLVLNVFWSFLFFGLHNPWFALIEIIALLIFIILTTINFWRTNLWAGILMLPYIAWVGFATILNFAYWRLNS